MEFKNMKQRMIDHFNSALGSEYLFEVELDKDDPDMATLLQEYQALPNM